MTAVLIKIIRMPNRCNFLASDKIFTKISHSEMLRQFPDLNIYYMDGKSVQNHKGIAPLAAGQTCPALDGATDGFRRFPACTRQAGPTKPS